MTQPVGVAPLSSHYVAPWCTEDDLPKGRLVDSSGKPIGDVQLGWMICAATDLLYVLSGRKFRNGRSVVRPAPLVRDGRGGPAMYPYSSMSGYGDAWGFASGWAWSALGLGWYTSDAASEITLQGPVRRINQVLVDGTPLGADQFTLYNRRRLVRNGGGPWPWNQDLSLPLTSPGTWQIDYEWGPSTPASGRLACAELSIELALTFSGQDSAKLPSRVLSIATEGVSVAVGDALDFLKESLTGLPICDMFLQAENPKKRRRRAAFISPNQVLGRST